MNCKACNTRLSGGQKVCPNCGHADNEVPFIDSPDSDASGSEPEVAEKLSPSTLGAASDGADPSLFEGGEIEFEEEIEMALREAAPEESPAPTARASSKKTKAPKRKAKEVEAPPVRENAPRSRRSPVNVVIPVDPEQVRHLIVERPEVLEANLAVHVDEDGIEVGAGYETEVGEIDLLARSEAGDWVVVMVVPTPTDQESAITGMIHRIGWVRKHLSDGEQVVRGVVLTGATSEELVYAAAALKDSVTFLGWRLSLGFDTLAS